MRGGGPGGPGGPGRPAERAVDIKGTFAHIARYFAKEKALTFGLFAVVTLACVFGVIAPAWQSSCVDIISDAGEGDFATSLRWMLVAYLLYALFTLLQGWFSARLSCTVVSYMRNELFGKVIDLPVSYLDVHSNGDIMSRMTNDIESISMTVSESLPALVSGVLTIVAVAVAMLALCWQLALLSFVTVLLTVFASNFIAKRVFKYSRQRQALLGQVNSQVEETVSGFKTVTAFNRQDNLCAQFDETSDALTMAGIRAEAFAGIMGPLSNCISNISFLVVAVGGGALAACGITSIGVISAFIVYAKQLGRPVGSLADMYGQLQSALASAERVFEVLGEEPEDMTGAELEPDGDGHVSFVGVTFGYRADAPVLEAFSLEVPAGKKIALVGATGSGKTTVVSLLERFYDIQAGCISVDGQDIAGISRASLRSEVAIVLQDTTLFAATVADNLRYGNLDATDEELEEALRLSHAYDMVMALPQGLQTQLKPGGEDLSQGQRQLLAIARAFVANPRILILDEATSNVDTRTERDVAAAMSEIMRDRTSICIAHRLSTIVDADEIVVMDEGRVCERGTHAELLAAHGRYWQLTQAQFAGAEI